MSKTTNEGGRVAAIMGATSGIGRATASILAGAGFRVIANGRREQPLRELQKELNGKEHLAEYFVGDATLGETVRNLVARSEQAFHVRPDAFVLCAGHGLPGTLLGSDESKWAALLEANVLGVMRQLRECARCLVEERMNDRAAFPARDIVVIGSTVGRQVSAANPVYGSTKFAVHSLVESMRQELCGHGIRVTLIEPGFVRTSFQEVAGYDMNWVSSLERELGPFLEAEDVGRVIAFVLNQPPQVHLDDVRMRPTRQKV